MFSFALYGRVGQGVRSASRIIAKAAFYSHFKTQALIPYANGVQTGFIKVDKLPISSRSPAEPDVFLIFDRKIDAHLKNAKKGSIIIVNSGEKVKIKTKNKVKIFHINATQLALEATQRQTPNIAMLGAFVKTFGKLPLKHVKKAIEDEGLLKELPLLETGMKSVKR